jgi:uncharacterized membrane protein
VDHCFIAYVANAIGAIEVADKVAKVSNSAGLIMALLAMLAGAFELRKIDSRSEAMRVATWHMMLMSTVWFCFVAALMLQVSAGLDRSMSQFAAAACAVAGFLLTIAGAWLGGRLVYGFGVAVKNESKP